jgi:transaldolase
MAASTPTSWWHDSADAGELARGLSDGATGVTTNPALIAQALRSCGHLWADELREALPGGRSPFSKAEAFTSVVVRQTAKRLLAVYERTNGRAGYVCAQVDPGAAADRAAMEEMARRYHALAPNVAVKLPVTAAGLDVLELCVAEGIPVNGTVSFTVPQALAIAEACKRGTDRARKAGKQPGRCFATIMIGRRDDYLRDVALDNRAPVSEEDIRQAGLAVVKRAYEIYRSRGCEVMLCIAALRGTYHLTELLGGSMVLSIHPKIQAMSREGDLPREEGIERPIADETIARLRSMPEFVRAYEPDGLSRDEFVSYALVQRTLSQFLETGWKQIESFDPATCSAVKPKSAD